MNGGLLKKIKQCRKNRFSFQTDHTKVAQNIWLDNLIRICSFLVWLDRSNISRLNCHYHEIFGKYFEISNTNAFLQRYYYYCVGNRSKRTSLNLLLWYYQKKLEHLHDKESITQNFGTYKFPTIYFFIYLQNYSNWLIGYLGSF